MKKVHAFKVDDDSLHNFNNFTCSDFMKAAAKAFAILREAN